LLVGGFSEGSDIIEEASLKTGFVLVGVACGEMGGAGGG
jgi:hypothetical protein